MTMNSLNVLIIDDAADDVMLVVRELQKANYDVKFGNVDNEAELVKKMEQQQWDVVLCDYTMPTFNGIEALNVVRRYSFDIPFIFVSGTLSEDMAVSAMKAGANDYVTKGNLKRLIPAIEREIRDARVRHDHKKTQAALDESTSRFSQAFNHSPMGMALVSLDFHFLEINQMLAEMLSFQTTELGSRNFSTILHPEDQNIFNQIALDVLEGRSVFQEIELRLQSKTNKDVLALLNLSLVSDSNKNPLYFIVQIEDITEKRKVENQLNYLAHHDALTDLANRHLFEEGLKNLMELSKLQGNHIAVILLNVNRFSLINETFGYAAGDYILKSIASRLKNNFLMFDAIARVGNDEFALLMTRTRAKILTETVLPEIHRLLSEPFEWEGQKVTITASVGISLFPEHGETVTTLLKNANTALHEARLHGGNDYRIFSKAMLAKVSGRVATETALREALDRKQFVNYYQPKIELKSGKLVGAEALVRWQRSGNQLLAPDEFIGLAEDTGLIIPLGAAVFDMACDYYKTEKLLENNKLSIAINLSLRQFGDRNLIKTIEEILTKYAMEPSLIEIEITETLLMQNIEKNHNIMNALKSLGVKVAIDDFGTGYSSLNYLKNFNIDTLKIDQSFLRNLARDKSSRAIVLAIISLAHSLELNVVAEGVETQEQMKFLMDHGCDQIQGYYISKPLSSAEFSNYIATYQNYGKA